MWLEKNSEQINLVITSEQTVNELDLNSASGEYIYQYILNGAPMYTREGSWYDDNASYDRRKKSYMLWFGDGKWHLKYKYSDQRWENGIVLFRKKTNCK